MSISTKANQLDNVEQAFVAMATEMNKGVLRNLGLLTPELEEAKNGDLMIVIKGPSDEANEATLIAIEDLFNKKIKAAGSMNPNTPPLIQRNTYPRCQPCRHFSKWSVCCP